MWLIYSICPLYPSLINTEPVLIQFVCCYRQLLLDCGLGNGCNANSSDGAIVSQHRALVFCQLQGMLDIIEHDLLKWVYFKESTVPSGTLTSLYHSFFNQPHSKWNEKFYFIFRLLYSRQCYWGFLQFLPYESEKFNGLILKSLR